MNKIKQDLQCLGKLMGQKIYIDMEDTNPFIFEYAEKFFNEQIENAEIIRKIKELTKSN